MDSSIFLKKAHELKEEGNKRFQNKDYVGALEQYDNALKLTPKTHLDKAVFHSNRAACLMQMKPIDYDTVIAECTMALQVQPRFVRALLRRARAFEAIGKYEMPNNIKKSKIGWELELRIISRNQRSVEIGNLLHCIYRLCSSLLPGKGAASTLSG